MATSTSATSLTENARGPAGAPDFKRLPREHTQLLRVAMCSAFFFLGRVLFFACGTRGVRSVLSFWLQFDGRASVLS